MTSRPKTSPLDAALTPGAKRRSEIDATSRARMIRAQRPPTVPKQDITFRIAFLLDDAPKRARRRTHDTMTKSRFVSDNTSCRRSLDARRRYPGCLWNVGRAVPTSLGMHLDN